ncbi:hypothetical protein P3X46_011386 [Hevea brasiliensis]|uniref:Uncharacterized protein n=1 Tax=Hevea brasiliensis TaxID=3981 RepID=A0ABQ9MKI1_HEVBR|nr:hypothetical protein P3X46_011386 [Hevea brasiliensis]
MSSALKTSSSSTYEPKIILKGLLKPTQEDPVSLTLKQSQQLDSGEEEQHPEDNEETIKKIGAKMERMRQSRAAAPDNISLDGGSNHGAAEGLSDE